MEVLTFLEQGNENAGGLGVLNSILEGFLGDAVEMGGDSVVTNQHTFRAVHLADDLGTAVHAGGEFAQSDAESIAGQIDGTESMGKIARLGNGIVQQRGDSSDANGFRRGFGNKIAPQKVGSEGNADELLTNAVVEMLAEATLFTIAHLNDFLFKALTIGDVLSYAGDAKDVTGGITNRERAVMNPANGAIRTDDTIFL